VSAVTPPEIVKQMADLAIKYDLVVMSDEIYADQMYTTTSSSVPTATHARTHP
jgi:aspartate/methionine/tyrosine aminotransferase